MPSVVDALVAAVQTGKPLKKPDPFWVPRLETATGDARTLLEAIATHKPPLYVLGVRWINANIGTFAMAAKRLKKTLPFDTERSCAMGGAYSTKVDTWGFKWDTKKLELVELSEKGKVTTYTPAKWLAHVRTEELDYWKKQKLEPGKQLTEFLAAAGKPAKART